MGTWKTVVLAAAGAALVGAVGYHAGRARMEQTLPACAAHDAEISNRLARIEQSLALRRADDRPAGSSAPMHAFTRPSKEQIEAALKGFAELEAEIALERPR